PSQSPEDRSRDHVNEQHDQVPQRDRGVARGVGDDLDESAANTIHGIVDRTKARGEVLSYDYQRGERQTRHDQTVESLPTLPGRRPPETIWASDHEEDEATQVH